MASNLDSAGNTERDFVTIVSGLPRSGTSMMMGILQAGGIPALIDGVRAADPDNPRGYFEFEAVKRTKQDPSWLLEARGKAVKMVYRLLRDLPDDIEYRVIFMRRDMREIHASQEAMLERNGQTASSMAFAEFAKVFSEEMRRVLSWSAAETNFETLEVDYGEVVSNPRPQLEAIDAFLGGGLEIEAMQGVVEPGLYRKRA